MGQNIQSPGFPRPPLAPGWLLYPFVQYWGFDIGYKVWSAVASLAPVVPVVLFARRIGHDKRFTPPLWVVPFAAGFILLDLLHAEMLVTGALPLLAFGLLGIAWWAMSSLVARRGPKTRYHAWLSLVLTASIGLIPWINQTTAGLAVITLPVYAMALLWYHRRAQLRWAYVSLAPPMFVGGVIALLSLPWYMAVLPGSGMLDYPGATVYFTRWGDPAWTQMAIGVSLGLLMMWKGRAPWLRSLGVVLILLSVLTIFLSFDETIINLFFRSRYLMQIAFYPGLTWLMWRFIVPWFQGQYNKGPSQKTAPVP